MSTATPSTLLSPNGQLCWIGATRSKSDKQLTQIQDSGDLLLELATAATENLDESAVFWRDYTADFISALCRLPGLYEGAWRAGPQPPTDATLLAKMLQAPSSKGMEYLTTAVLQSLWQQMQAALLHQVTTHHGDIQQLLRERYPAWHTVGRITLHLAENPRDEQRPFAFLATYAHKLNARGATEHLPLARALKDYATDTAALHSLLEPLSRAANQSSVLSELLQSKRIFNAVAWTPEQAFAFLQEVPPMESAGLVIKVPDWWQNRRPPAPQVQVVLDAGEQHSGLGLEALLKFRISVAVEGQALSEEELQKLLQSTAPLLSLKGKWIQPDREKLQQALAFWHKAQQANEQGIPFYQGLRWLAGWQARTPTEDAPPTGSSSIQAGPHLQAWLQQLQANAIKPQAPPIGLRAKLRPYQQEGLDWLSFMTSVGLGACLADDMGLGKTLQLLALLLRYYEDGCRAPSLIVAPASLLGNWQREFNKFAPELKCYIAHSSSMSYTQLQTVAEGTHPALKQPCVFITTYAQTGRLKGLQQTPWEILALDEAQTIKNASSQQAQHIRQLHAKAKIALSGTPIENRLTDLWSLFEFLNPGLLGSPTDFAIKARSLSASGGYAALRQLVRPFILRRVKTDPHIAPDLPRKTEVTTFCGLSKRQATLYQRAINEMQQALKQTAAPPADSSEEAAAATARRGIILGMLLKLKQICNHPSLFSGDQVYAAEDSGKFARLTELITQIADRQEKVLIFTQFREMTEVLAQHLVPLFGRAGLILHGGTAIAKRSALVEQFQQPAGPPFFVISVKAGGTGLTLTAANHVIHFDRWWNPAVEDQATDRAYRIGQTQPVLVHKMVTRGTLEERIDRILKDKKNLQNELLDSEPDGGAIPMLTQMSDSELLSFLSLAEEWQD